MRVWCVRKCMHLLKGTIFDPIIWRIVEAGAHASGFYSTIIVKTKASMLQAVFIYSLNTFYSISSFIDDKAPGLTGHQLIRCRR